MIQKEILIKYLEENCKGYENRQKAFKLMQVIDVEDHKTFRSIVEEIRQDDDGIFICSEAGKKGGYWIPTTYDEVQDTLNHLHKRAKEMLKTYSILRKKIKRKGI
jgi:hypothetical protein